VVVEGDGEAKKSCEVLDCLVEVLHNFASLLVTGHLDGAAGVIFKNLDNR
jgi:hypothetical protein